MDIDEPITLQLLWQRLISICDQADVALGRAAFSPIVREGHDYVTVLLDPRGKSVAQCTASIPSFIGALTLAAKHFLRAFPVESLDPGDVLITNDPWISTGHLPDITMITPIFRKGRLVALAGNIAHMADIGGRPLSPDASDVFEEGIRLPILKLYKRGQPNQDVFDIIEASVRVPNQVLGDLAGQVAANDVMARLTEEFIAANALDDLTPLGDAIHRRCEMAMRAAIRSVPDGDYVGEITADGFDEEIQVRAVVSVLGDRIHVDYSGSSQQQRYGINVVPNYRYAHTVYAIKCLLDPETPNSEGALAPISDSAPVGTVLNPAGPVAVNGRNMVGHMIPACIFRALQTVLPDRVLADGGGAPIWALTLVGERSDHSLFVVGQFVHGGMGAQRGLDGLDTLSFPSNCKTTSVEMLEKSVPVLVEEKELIADSGGAGAFRGGLGQRFRLRSLSDKPMRVYLRNDKVGHPPQGLQGGQPGRRGYVAIHPGGELEQPKGTHIIPPHGVLVLETPGGGGFGEPCEREEGRSAEDLRLGLVSVERTTTRTPTSR